MMRKIIPDRTPFDQFAIMKVLAFGERTSSTRPAPRRLEWVRLLACRADPGTCGRSTEPASTVAGNDDIEKPS
jgi:hypothetical protein